MPKNQVSDLITDQEIAFARLVLSGTMTDCDAAQAVGLNPGTAAYTKAKPSVRAYMAEHRAAVQQQFVEQEAEDRRRFSLGREQVLRRLWEIANMGSEMTRGSITGQVKALSIIVAMENMIPDRRAGSSEKKPVTTPTPPPFYVAAWRAEQERKAAALQSGPAFAQEEDQSEFAQPEPTPAPSGIAYEPGEPAFANRFSPPETTPSEIYPLVFDSSPHTREPFSIKTGPFARRRWAHQEEPETL